MQGWTRWNSPTRRSQEDETRPSQFPYQNKVAYRTWVDVLRNYYTLLTYRRRKTPTLANGNNTFLLTHTRYDPKNERIQQKSIPLVSVPLPSVEDSAVPVTSDADTSSQTPQPRPIIPIQRKTFSRDQPIGHQIKQVLNAVSTDRKVCLTLCNIL